MQATGIRDSATILMKLANYAKPIMTTMDDQGEILESPIKQGSGLVQVKNLKLPFFDIMTNFSADI